MFFQLLAQAILVGAAAGYLLRAWQTGSIFAGIIAELETGGLREVCKQYGRSTRMVAVAGKLEDLLLCPLCLAPYVVTALWLLTLIVPPVGSAVTVIFAGAQVAYWLRSM